MLPIFYKQQDFVQYTRGLYGVKRGVSRIMELLDRLNIKATFNVCGYIAKFYPQVVQDITRNSLEIFGNRF